MANWTLVLPNNTTLGLTENNDLAVVGISGAGMPPINNIYTSYGLADGALYQRSAVQPRLVTILVDAAGTSWVGLHNLRATLIEAVNPHQATPITLKYSAGGSKPDLYLDCYYDGGLEGGVTEGFVEKGLALRLLATDPYWEAAAGTAHTLGVRQSVADVSAIVWREADGTINNMDEGVAYPVGSPEIRSITRLSTTVQAYGAISAAGATPSPVAVLGMAQWNGAAWADPAPPWNASIADYASDGAFTYSAVAAPDGIYAPGSYTSDGGPNKYGIWHYDGTSWTWIAASGQVTAIAVSPGGVLYAAVGGTVYYYNTATSAWVSIGAAVTVWAMIFDQQGSLYAGGAFTTIGGVTAARVAKYAAAAWTALGDGLDNAVSALAIGPDGTLYAGGDFTASGTKAMAHVAQWNGVSWEKMGDGLDSTVYALDIGDDGLVAAGAFDASGSRALPSRAAYWRDNVWLDSGLGYPSSMANLYTLNVEDDIYAGGTFNGTWVGAGATTVTNNGTARAYPKFTLTGPGVLYHIVNYTTDQWIHFNLTLNAGETLTIDLTPGVKTVTSSFRGNMIGSIVSGNLIDFYLAPGDNYIGAWIDDASATGTYQFTARYWSSDGKST